LSTQDFSNLESSPAPLADDPAAASMAIVDLLESAIGPDLFDMWFSRECVLVEGLDSGNRSVKILAKNEFSLRRMQQAFSSDIKTAVQRVCGVNTSFVVEVAEFQPTDELAVAETSVAVDPGNFQQAIPFNAAEPTGESRSLRRSLPTLESFAFSPDAKLLKAAVAQLFESPGQFSPLMIYGPTGSGKTHLLEAITHGFRKKLRLKRCVYVSAEQFTTQFVGALRQGTGLPMFRRKFRDLDLLAIDDIQFLAGKKATLAEFQQTLDNLVRLGKQVVLSADRSALELDQLGQDICARISAGLTCSVGYPDLQGRVRIAQRMCASRGMTLPNDVLHLICEQLPRDIRRLSGAINRIQAYSMTFGDTVDVAFASEVLADLFTMSGPSCTSMIAIEKAVCEFCRVDAVELKSSSRQKRISSARMLAMYLSREYTGSAFSEIGDYFGGRSHSTVIAAKRKVEKWIENDEGISLPHAKYSAKEALRRLESNLRIS
jgi:chromosomal replication initiator protein